MPRTSRVFAWYAAHSLGAVVVAVNAWLSPDAFFHCLRLTQPTAIFVDQERAEVLQEKVGQLGAKAVFTVRTSKRFRGFDPLEEVLKEHKERKLPDISIVDEVRLPFLLGSLLG